MYVEGTFFNRSRAEDAPSGCTDLSEPIRSFCSELGISAPPPDPSQPLKDDEKPAAASQKPGSLAELARSSATLRSRRPLYPLRRTELEVPAFP